MTLDQVLVVFLYVSNKF